MVRKKDPAYYNFPQMFMPQVDWLKDDSGKIAVDKIIRFEDLPDAFNGVAEAIGISSNLPNLNVTANVDYKLMFNEQTKNVIATHFKEDIELFNYKF